MTLEQIFFRFLKENNSYVKFKKKYNQRVNMYRVRKLNINKTSLKDFILQNGFKSPKSLLYNGFMVDDIDDSALFWYKLFMKWSKLCEREKIYSKFFIKNKTK